ncbi:hypothetical protein INS49_012868 [Diaporthe citri]|uniref:uncharacterized protein n=1 Tax=Diaporthe citri TaxID=83186 RepID=UPI001C80D4D0|nr:uncharacterized protein INS49_012868 [Diaporthe citri]KAG6359347.1 hypothetical protein INS49_012868 [Diaporthe citri]
MAQQTFPTPNGFAMQSSGLASRRGGQSIKPLSVDALKSPVDSKENAIPTPRTARGHLLAGLRTAPKSAAASTFAASGANTSPTNKARNNTSLYGVQENMLNNGPKTSLPHFGNQQGFNNNYGRQQFTPEQILAPPEIPIHEQAVDEQLDPDLYAKLVQQNLQLAQQRQMLQQQLYDLTQAQQQLSAMNLNGQQSYQNLYQQQQLQQQALQMQSMLNNTMVSQQPTIYTYIDPATGQQAYYVDQSAQLNAQFVDPSQLNLYQQQQRQQNSATPRVQVSPPREAAQPVFRRNTPPRRNESPLIENPAPLPPPSANAFRRGHKKSNLPSPLVLRLPTSPLTPLTGGYGPGQARAGEHPIRQPRGPPSIEELKAKPSAKHEASKNFAARTRSALNNLMRAGLERRKVSSTGSSGSISPISETAEEAQGLLTDNESESGRSGSGSLNGEEVEPSVPSSRTSTGSWGAIGSDRPSSRQKARKSADSISSGSGDETASNGSFASVFKRTGRNGRSDSPSQRKSAMMVLTCAEKRKNGVILS